MKTNHDKAVKATIFSIIANTILALLKWISGILGQSQALIADGIESTADIFASLFVLFGINYAQRPADDNHPYGHGRVEPLTTFMVVGFLIISATVIAFQSIHNIQSAHSVPQAWTLLVLAPIIIWKEISYRIVMKRAKEIKSATLKAEAWHHRSDAITSIAAFLGISMSLYLGKGFENADNYAALFAAVFILYNCYKIVRPALGEIMDENVYPELIEEIRKISLSVPRVLATEKCYVRKLGMVYQVDLHAIVDGNLTVTEGHDIAHELKDTLIQEIPEIHNVHIHIEPSNPNYLQAK